MADKKYLIGGNWKCNGTKESVAELVQTLNNGGDFPANAEVVVAPPFLFIDSVMQTIRPDIAVSTQNIGKNTKTGAFTGEIAAPMAKAFGLNWVITGHSERRSMEGETSAIVAEKSKIALDNGLSVIACCGEQLSDREAGNTLAVVLEDHLQAMVDAFSTEDWARVVIAYEPVWAIGTGVVASPEQAQEVHAAIRKFLSEKVSPEVSAATRVIYGGSVKGSNAGTLKDCPDIDGFLVGGAALTADFLTIINAVA
mmetsp:Transcript_7793/g.11867  ORF Transcript_7793/g.11867 Transcript_7793/m.11867 type:complete len:254 (-) Transcript_7793:233-994(-)|eukprot:CAMPEP_0113935664 /NCGR_PEP_ID=MMETSP1339-20121228/2773_1 /TAXON_ID=94617 /ORGANISM="Fibrocapsa japonica" /LENGTH=253 /DNA_ID=CAMNT_0000937897 /DNA_START=112 /DNA_END=873 /DNA_ORIENTATION=+ /assembly_acc=CAM_ASM_000762